jgi:hypothetical protein
MNTLGQWFVAYQLSSSWLIAQGAVVYSLLLVGGFLAQAIQYTIAGGERMHLFVRCITFTAATIRFTTLLPSFLWPLQNKYVMWTVLYGVMRHARPFIHQMDIVSLRLTLLALVSMFAISGYAKIKGGYYSNGDSPTGKGADLKRKLQ